MKSDRKAADTAVNIEQRFNNVLRTEGIGLGAFRVYGFESPFLKILCRSTQRDANVNPQPSIRISADNQGNVRAFYYLMLCSCFKPSSEQLTVPQQISSISGGRLLMELKSFLLDDATDLEPLSRQLNDRSEKRVLSNNVTMKKFLAELLYMLSKNRSEDIASSISMYPIADLLLIVLMRTLVMRHQGKVGMRVDSKIETDAIVAALRDQFKLKIESNAFEVIYEDSISIREESDYIYIDRLPQDKKQDSQHKKTQASQGALSRSIVMDNTPPIDNIPPLSLDMSNGKRIMSLNNARQCSSKRNSYDDSPRKMSEEGELMNENRARKLASSIDDSNDSGSSCVIERIEFGQGILKKCQDPPSVNQNFRKSKFEPRAEPDNQVQAAESRDKVEEVQWLPRMTNKTIKNQQPEKSKFQPASVGKMNEEVKTTLCDGTTSQWVLKLMSPSVARVVDQKKEQSLKEIMKNIQRNRQSSLAIPIKNTAENLHPSQINSSGCVLRQNGTIKFANRENPNTTWAPQLSTSNIRQRSLSKQQFTHIVTSPKIVFTYTNNVSSRQDTRQEVRHTKNSSMMLASNGCKLAEHQQVSPPSSTRRVVVPQARQPINFIKKFYE